MKSQSVVSLEEVAARGEISDVDVLKLRRAFYADNAIDQAEAHQLIALNRATKAPSAVWVDCFVEMLTDYVVNQAEPEGYVTVEHADWLKSALTIDGRIATRAEFELLVNILDKSRWSPQSLAKFALDQVRDAIVERTGVLASPAEEGRPAVKEAEVEILRRIIYAFGGDANVSITQIEAETLFEIEQATLGAENCPCWSDLFVKAIANCVLSASGYVVPSREHALARDAWLDRRGDLSVGRMVSGMLPGYRQMSREEWAIAALERQKIEIVTGEQVTAVEAVWLADRIGRDGTFSPNEIALVEFVRREQPTLHPALQDVINRLAAAA